MEIRFIVARSKGSGREVGTVIQAQEEGCSGNRIVQYFDCGGEYMKLHVIKLYITKCIYI